MSALDWPALAGAFMVGLAGLTHCAAMCGGIATALSLGGGDGQPRATWVIAYNAGRISTYALLGAAGGAVSGGVVAAADLAFAQSLMQWIAGAFLIALGLYIGRWWQGLAWLERAGHGMWRRVEPLGRRFLPLRSWRAAYAVGLVWGFLPCGLVYGALALTLWSGSAAGGALVMLAFGLGTVPAMGAIGLAAARVAPLLRAPAVRAAGGALVILFGVLLLLAERGAQHAH